jgi:Flp pilus assembly secretin CpaC
MRNFPGIKAVLAAAALVAGLSQASAENISVQVNQAKIIKLTRAADTIVIGNPQIVDASVQDATTIVLTGKGFGSTNLVVLDEAGAPIVDQQVVVSRDEASTVRIYRRASVQTLSCQPTCETALVSDAERASAGQ